MYSYSSEYPETEVDMLFFSGPVGATVQCEPQHCCWKVKNAKEKFTQKKIVFHPFTTGHLYTLYQLSPFILPLPLLAVRVSQMLSLATTLCSQESSSLGLPEFPVDNLSPALHVLVCINKPDRFFSSYCFWKKGENSEKVFFFPPCVVSEYLPHDVLSAAHPQTLSLQEHPGQGGTHSCGECTQCRSTCELLKVSEVGPGKRCDWWDHKRFCNMTKRGGAEQKQMDGVFWCPTPRRK